MNFGTGRTIEEFWKWFSTTYGGCPTSADGWDIVSGVNDELDQFAYGVTCSVSDANETPREIVFVANGERQLMPVIIEIVRNAPIIRGWKITAFRQPVPKFEGSHITWDDQKYSTETIWFRHVPMENNFGIVLYFEHFDNLQGKDYETPAKMLIEWAVGEYNYLRHFIHHGYQKAPSSKSGQGLHSLGELPQFYRGMAK